MKSVKYFLITCIVLISSSCDFKEKNVNPNSSSNIEPGPLLTYSLLNTGSEGLAKRTQIGYCMMMVQQTASLEREEAAGDKYFETETYGVFFNDVYTSGIKNLQELITKVENDNKYTNTYAVALIWKSFLFHRLTDLYGDIPYSEAGNGYRNQNFYPVYDAQEAVYLGMVADIEKALKLFDIQKEPIVNGDIIYGGDIAKWKRFGNSLLLRFGMRLEKAKPELAKSLVVKAIQNGVMQEPEDIAMVKHVAGKSATENPVGKVFKSSGLINSGSIKISKTFMTHMKQTQDPRLKVYSALPNGNTDFAVQKGLPNGFDILNISFGDPSYKSLSEYSNFNPETFIRLDAPTIYMTHAEVALLTAEAIVKGWISGDANEVYKAAVRSSMKQQAIYGNAGIIEDDAIEKYLAEGLFVKATTTAQKLNVLGTEFWVATFINGYESYANWRRTGYPVLTPINYEGSPNRGKIPRRFKYPTVEYNVNPIHVQEAVNRQGPDLVSTRVWWDK